MQSSSIVAAANEEKKPENKFLSTLGFASKYSSAGTLFTYLFPLVPLKLVCKTFKNHIDIHFNVLHSKNYSDSEAAFWQKVCEIKKQCAEGMKQL